MTIEVLEKQRQASDPERSVYVSASAGSGKTKVLIDRILRLILSGAGVFNILCLTFTNAAAEEIVARLKQKAKKWSSLDTESLVAELCELTQKVPSEEVLKLAKSLYLELLKNQHKLKIKTLHAFCTDILQIESNAKLAKRSIKIISSGDQKLLLKKAFDQILSEDSLKEPLSIVAKLYGSGYLFEIVTKLVRQCANFSQYMNRFVNHEELAAAVFLSFGLEVHKVTFQSYVFNLLSNLDLEPMKRIAQTLQSFDENLGEFFEKWIESELEEKMRTIDRYALQFLTRQYKMRKSMAGAKSLPKNEQEMLEKHQKDVFVLMQRLHAFKAAEANLALIQVSKAVFECYSALKTEMGVNDYDELLLQVLDRLSLSDQSDWFLWNLDSAIDHILIDEAQDLNRYQWEIVKLLSQEFFVGLSAKNVERTIFIVGDSKQSIFEFQGAEPKMFEDICLYYREKCRQSLKKWSEIDFDTSFRSGREILDLVDEVFVNNQGFANYHRHKSSRNSLSCVEIWSLDRSETYNDLEQRRWSMPTSDFRAVSKQDELANLICHKVHAWLANSRLILGKEREIEPKDIMIIFRKRGAIYKTTSKLLKELQLPVESNGALLLKEQLPALDMIVAVKFVLNPGDDFNLLLLLKSPFVNMGGRDIYELICNNREGRVFDRIALCIRRKEIKGLLQQMINQHRNLLDCEFLSWLGSEYAKCSHAKQEVQNVVTELLQSFWEFKMLHPFKNLSYFIKWFDSSNIQAASCSRDKKSAIKLVTAHSSKGMQSPVVILADAFESDNVGYDDLFWHEEELFFSGCSEHDETLNELKNQKKAARRSESNRLLYVAMTRAEDELYACGIEGDQSRNWYSLIANALDSKERKV